MKNYFNDLSNKSSEKGNKCQKPNHTQYFISFDSLLPQKMNTLQTIRYVTIHHITALYHLLKLKYFPLTGGVSSENMFPVGSTKKQAGAHTPTLY